MRASGVLSGPACETPRGTYRIALPDRPAPAGRYPALLFFHGAGGTGARTLSNAAMVSAFTQRRHAAIGPAGLSRPGSRFGPGWSFHLARERGSATNRPSRGR